MVITLTIFLSFYEEHTSVMETICEQDSIVQIVHCKCGKNTPTRYFLNIYICLWFYLWTHFTSNWPMPPIILVTPMHYPVTLAFKNFIGFLRIIRAPSSGMETYFCCCFKSRFQPNNQCHMGQIYQDAEIIKIAFNNKFYIS